DLQSNGILQLHPEDFKGLVNLQTIDLSSNEISFIDERVFAELPSLREIKINNNKLTEIPIFKQNPVLERLELTHNQIHTINPVALQHLKKLDLLDLSNNVLREVTNTSFPANLSLTKLYVKNNELLYFEVGCLYNLTKLEHVKMSKNKISHLPKDIFAKSSSIKVLDLSKNKLTRLMGLTFQGLTGLQRLRLQRNDMLILEDGVFYGLSNLRNLQLDDNNLTTISHWLYGLDNLTELNVSGNKITRIEPKSWEYAPHLTTLALQYNQLVTLESDSLSSLGNLVSLSLAGNYIEFIEEDAFKHVKNLVSLDLSSNRISSVIEDIRGAFNGLASLKTLNLERNLIKTITKQAFMGLEKMEHLRLHSNNITSIQGNAFESLPNLRELSFNSSSLFCDCQLSWVPIWLRDNNFERSVVAKCAHPDNLKGRSIFAVDSSDFKCDGQFLKPEIVLNPRSQNILKGDNVTLNCTAASTESKGSPTQFQWKKDNVILTNVKTEDTAQRSGNLTHYVSRLHILDARDTDAARYQCVISNEYGSAYSKRANINVYVFPRFTKRPVNVTAKAQTEATLVCAAEGEPKPLITWQKDGGFDHFPAAQERRMHVIPEDDHFFIMNVKAADEGIYSCIAKNDAGTIVANVTLTVLQTPSFVRPMEHKETREKETSVLECLAQGSPQPTLTWFHKGQPLELGQRHFFTAEKQLLIIVETEKGDAGEYTCEMSNTLGTIRGTSKLTVVTGSVGSGGKEGPSTSGGGGTGGLDDESTTTGIIIIAVVCCVVGTSLVWVIIIYQTRKRQELYSATPTDETTLPGEGPSSGCLSSDKEGSYTHGVPLNGVAGYQYQELQTKESGYESSSGRFRAIRPAIFPSDVHGDEVHEQYEVLTQNGHYIAQSDENSLSSEEYQHSDTDSVKSEESQSVGSSHSSHQRVLSTFHPVAASRERIARSRSCSTSQIPRDVPLDDMELSTYSACTKNKPNLDNSVASQTDDSDMGDVPFKKVNSSTSINRLNNNSVCRNCSECNLPDSSVCMHMRPPSIPPKPSRQRHGRHKEHTLFDRAQPPGMSRSSSDIPDYLYRGEDIPTSPHSHVHEFHPPPPPPLLGYPAGFYLGSDYDTGVCVSGVPRVPNGAFVPVYHPVNTPCECQVHMAPPPPHSQVKDASQTLTNKPNSASKLNNHRLNGTNGCVHRPVNGVVGVAGQWPGHAFTLPYRPAHWQGNQSVSRLTAKQLLMLQKQKSKTKMPSKQEQTS
ncbi:hypothetical protein DPMN_005211, partial [Dreissena polymorpha]